MKIHIIGCSGSGKTYLANALSKKYNISHFDLDDIQWDNNAKEYGKKRTLDERKALLQEILYNNDEWIIEGVYYAWVQQSFDEADKIYVLDMPGYLYKNEDSRQPQCPEDKESAIVEALKHFKMNS